MRSIIAVLLLAGIGYGTFKYARSREMKRRASMVASQSEMLVDSPDVVDNKPASTEPQGFLGVVLTGDTVDVAPKVDGRVEQVFVKPGDIVRKGDSIAQLDVNVQKHQLVAARAQAGEAGARAHRLCALARSGAASRAECSEASSMSVSATARVKELMLSITEANMKAPFDGVIAARFLDAGSVIGPGHPVVRLLGKSDPKVRFAIPEEKFGDVIAGAKVLVHVTSPSVDLDGEVDSVTPEIDAGSRLALGTCKVKLPDGKKVKLSMGQVAYVKIAGPLKAEADAANSKDHG